MRKVRKRVASASHLVESVCVCERMLIQALHYTLQLPQSFTLSCFLYLSCYRKSISLLADGWFGSHKLLPSARCGSIHDSQMCGSTNRMCCLLPNPAFTVEVGPLCWLRIKHAFTLTCPKSLEHCFRFIFWYYIQAKPWTEYAYISNRICQKRKWFDTRETELICG